MYIEDSINAYRDAQQTSTTTNTTNSAVKQSQMTISAQTELDYVTHLRPLRFEALPILSATHIDPATHQPSQSYSYHHRSSSSSSNTTSTSTSYPTYPSTNQHYPSYTPYATPSYTTSHTTSSSSSAANSRKRTTRLLNEISTLSSSLPIEYGSSVFIKCDEDRYDVLKALIVG